MKCSSRYSTSITALQSNFLYRHTLHKSRRLRWAGHLARMEEDRSAFKMLAGTPTGKRPLNK